MNGILALYVLGALCWFMLSYIYWDDRLPTPSFGVLVTRTTVCALLWPLVMALVFLRATLDMVKHVKTTGLFGR